MVRSLLSSMCVAALATAAPWAHAAVVTVLVSDPAGRPLADAVVMLETTSGRLPVSPMVGVQIAQTRRQFSPQVTVVTVGTPITFPNLDTVRHQVYSFSQAKTFELKLYAGVPAAPVVFDKPGIAVLGCNIHDHMVAWVVVADTPLHARSGATGRAQIEGVPAGSYRLRLWHSALRDPTEPTSTPLAVGNADLEQHATLNLIGSSK
jgi:plastocyanin